MQKISVGKSTARAYGFLFGRMFSIIGLTWLPALIYAGGSFLWLQNLNAVMTAAHLDTLALVQTGGLYLGVIVAVLLLHATIAIALTQEALGVRKDIALAHFVIGPRELRLFLAYVRLYLIFIVGYVALGVLTVLGIMQSAHFAATAGKAALSLGGVAVLPFGFAVVALVVWLAFVLSILRLAFLIAPIAAVEHQASLIQSWRLTKGSSWRIVGVILGVFVPVLLLAVACLWFWPGDGLAGAVHDMMATRPPDAKLLMQFEASHAFDFAAAGGVILVVMAALQAGATASAYRTVTGHEGDDSEDDAALVAPLTPQSLSHHDDGHGHEPEDHGGGHDDHGHGHDQGHGEHDSHAGEGHHGHHAEANTDELVAGHDHGHGDGGHDAHGRDGHQVQGAAGGNHNAPEQHDHEAHDGLNHDGHDAHSDHEHAGHLAESASGDNAEHHHSGHDEHAAAA